MDKGSLGDRMKKQYEDRTRFYLTRRQPVIIRLDGKAFHTYTKGLQRPFDEGLIEDMQQMAVYLCDNIQGVKCAYVQSDEISLLLTDYDTIKTKGWFDYNIQKMCSVSASLATAKFNHLRFKRRIDEDELINMSLDKHIEVFRLAHFDSRVFAIPDKEEVVNYFIWRQRDAETNSIAMLAQSLYSHSELNKKSCNEMQEMCFQKGVNWNDLPFEQKRGSLIVKNEYVNGERLLDSQTIEFHPDYNAYAIFDDIPSNFRLLKEEDVHRPKWEVVETPIFSKTRETILKFL